MTVYSSSCTSLDLAKKQAELRGEWPGDGEPECECGESAADNDQGICMGCGYWIHYRDNR